MTPTASGSPLKGTFIHGPVFELHFIFKLTLSDSDCTNTLTKPLLVSPTELQCSKAKKLKNKKKQENKNSKQLFLSTVQQSAVLYYK
jgi:hypothetical protein